MIINSSNSVKLLGITIDDKLNFSEHVIKLCKKANQKLHALARISNFMGTDKLRLILKSFIESQFAYCPLVWMFCTRKLNHRINRIHERALRLVYKDDHCLTFSELLRKDKSFTIHHRNLRKLALEMYKIEHNISPSIMKTIFPSREIPYNLRNVNNYKRSKVRTVFYGTNTITFMGPKIWQLLPDEIKYAKSLMEFKRTIRNWDPIGCDCRLCKKYVANLGFI